MSLKSVIWERVKKEWEKKKLLQTSNFSFPTMFSTLSVTNAVILPELDLPSENSFKLALSKLFLFGRWLNMA